MKETFQILVDTACDVADEYGCAGGVSWIPMDCIVDDSEVVAFRGPDDRAAITHIYEEQRLGKQVSTSQVTPAVYMDFFRKWASQGVDVLYIGLSSGLSATVQSAEQAARMIREEIPQAQIGICDSLAATGGIGVLLERAVNDRAKGMSMAETLEDLREARHHLRHWFMVDDLNFLFRGGRLSRSSALIGTALRIKPVLHVDENGKLAPLDKKRGRRQADRCMIEHYLAERSGEPGDRLYLCYTGDIEPAEHLAEQIKAELPDAQCILRYMSPVIGAHTGPGACTIIHMGK
ncbi:MAG: DegV family protein [Ndongobacter sp.]|nr:DegV family protein [Ndongobacter sp.]